LIGVLDYESGEVFCIHATSYDAQQFLEFLQLVLKKYPDQKIVMCVFRIIRTANPAKSGHCSGNMRTVNPEASGHLSVSLILKMHRRDGSFDAELIHL
jgi:hypothetical protein